MKLLSLDIATKTGWKTATASGTWNLKPRTGESEGMRVVRFGAKVRELIALEGITLIAYERPVGSPGSSAIVVASEMIGVLKALAIELGVDISCYSPSTIKMFATGKGNAGKPQMIAAAQAAGYNPQDDNEADAIHIYRMVAEEMGIK